MPLSSLSSRGWPTSGVAMFSESRPPWHWTMQKAMVQREQPAPASGSGSEPPGGEETVDSFLRRFVTTLKEADTRCKTTHGLSHGDLHGGNLLLDVTGEVWLIGYTTAAPGPSLNDFGQLLLATLVQYMPAAVEEDDAFEDLCVRLAAVPSTSTAFPLSPAATGRMRRLEEVVAALWPHVCAMDPGTSGAPVAWALLRYAVRMCDYPQCDAWQKQRSAFLATACAARLLADAAGSPCPWADAARLQWGAGSVLSASVSTDPSSEVLRAYVSDVGRMEAWQPDPITREMFCVEEACIHVVTQRLAERRRACIGPAALSTGLAKLFPEGLPSRLLVLGGGGTGKTMLSRQAAVAACWSSLDVAGGFIPFRVPLQEIAPITEVVGGWKVLEMYYEQAFGADSLFARALNAVAAWRQAGRRILLLLDGLDEATTRKHAVLTWLETLDWRREGVCGDALWRPFVVMTSRPSAADEMRHELSEAGFEGRRILPLTNAHVEELVRKTAARLGP